MFIVFGKPNCPNCDVAKNLLDAAGIEYVYIDVSDPANAEDRQFLVDNGFRSLPQIYQKDRVTHVGSLTQLRAALIPTIH